MALTTINNAISAYSQAARSFGESDSKTESVSGSGMDFASLLKDGVKSAIDRDRKSVV